MINDTKLIVIVGPPASGKSAAFNHLKKIYPDAHFHNEVNPFTVMGNNHQGGAYVDENLQRKIADVDLNRTKKVIGKGGLHIMETGIFGLVYIEELLGKEVAREYLEKYLPVYKQLNPTIVFIDTPPEESWRRRGPSYLRRAGAIENEKEREEAIRKYKDHIFRKYPLWSSFFEQLDLPKVKIKNVGITENGFLNKLVDIVSSTP